MKPAWHIEALLQKCRQICCFGAKKIYVIRIRGVKERYVMAHALTSGCSSRSLSSCSLRLSQNEAGRQAAPRQQSHSEQASGTSGLVHLVSCQFRLYYICSFLDKGMISIIVGWQYVVWTLGISSLRDRPQSVSARRVSSLHCQQQRQQTSRTLFATGVQVSAYVRALRCGAVKS